MVLYAYMFVFVDSRFVENPPIWSWETNPSFLRWFCYIGSGWKWWSSWSKGVQEHDWLSLLPHGDTDGHSVHCVPVYALLSFPTHFTSASRSADFQVFQIYNQIRYSFSSSLDLVGFFVADFAGCAIDRKSISGTCHFFGLKDRRSRPEGRWIGANQNSSRELGLCPINDPTPLSSNLAKTT
jgi:hypothetical protein